MIVNNRYLVVGLAKTGTTVISKTIQNSTGCEHYFLEPKKISFFEEFSEGKSDGVIKILFDHWGNRPRMLNSIIYNEFGINFNRIIFIFRDPRSEFISRLHYIAYPFFLNKNNDEKLMSDWIEIFRKKEIDKCYSLLNLLSDLKNGFGVNIMDQDSSINRQYADYVNRLPRNIYEIIQYEAFAKNQLSGHPLESILNGSRDVGPALSRTKRTSGEDDWTAYLNEDDLMWMNKKYADVLGLSGYREDIEIGGEIKPENCSIYVENLIRKAIADRG